MAKKHKTTDAEKDQMLETPAGAAIATETPFRADWPESTETRELNVSLTDDQIIEQSRVLIDKLREVETLTAAKKASADNYKTRIEEVEQKIEDVSIVVKSGKDRRQVPCRWLWQTNNFDASGAAIFHSEMKTLIREDTGEVVEVKPITFEDRQVNLPLGDEETLEMNQKAIMAAGYTLEETPDDSTLESPFVMIAPDGGETPIQADSMAEAAAKARKHIEDAATGDSIYEDHDRESVMECDAD